MNCNATAALYRLENNYLHKKKSQFRVLLPYSVRCTMRVNGREFVPAKQIEKKATDSVNYRVWSIVREPFLLPQCIHKCQVNDYENIDVDEAACTVCGSWHKCESKDCVFMESNGYKVCQITGYCVRNKIFADDEYVDTVAHMKQPYQVQVNLVDPALIEMWVEDMLLGHRPVLEQELGRNQGRREMIFVRIAKHYKAQRQPLNVVQILTCFLNAVANLRDPWLIAEAQLRPMVEKCISVVMRFCGNFFPYKHSMSSHKMRGFIVGIVYLLRRGMKINDTVQLLPKIDDLARLLPSETNLRQAFNVSTKVVTETENIIKKKLKTLSNAQLRDMGFT